MSGSLACHHWCVWRGLDFISVTSADWATDLWPLQLLLTIFPQIKIFLRNAVPWWVFLRQCTSLAAHRMRPSSRRVTSAFKKKQMCAAFVCVGGREGARWRTVEREQDIQRERKYVAVIKCMCSACVHIFDFCVCVVSLWGISNRPYRFIQLTL